MNTLSEWGKIRVATNSITIYPEADLDDVSLKISSFPIKYLLNLRTSASCQLETLERFLVNHGPEIESLYLKRIKDIDDFFIEKIFKYCPNLYSLFLNSEKIEGSSFKHFENLRWLDLSKCIYVIKLDLQNSKLLKLNLTGCEYLKKINLFNCSQLIEIIGLRKLVFLTKLNISNCSNLKTVDLYKCKQLRKFEFSSCFQLTQLNLRSNYIENLNFSGFTNLKELNLECDSLETLEGVNNLNLIELHLIGCEILKELDISGCLLLKIFDNELERLKKINVTGCKSLRKLDLSESYRLKEIHGLKSLTYLHKLYLSKNNRLDKQLILEMLSDLLEHDIRQWITLYEGFRIKDKKELRKLILSHLEKNFNSPQTSPTLHAYLAKHIDDNYETLRLNDNDPLMLQALSLISTRRIERGKNPFRIFEKIKKNASEKCEYQTPCQEINGINLTINMERLYLLNPVTVIYRSDLQQNVTKEAFDKLTDSLFLKLQDKRATRYLEDIGSTVAILQESIYYLQHLLILNSDIVSETESKWRAILASILAETNTLTDHFFSNQELDLITILHNISCYEIKKYEGIAKAYENLHPKYRYKAHLSKWMEVNDEFKNNGKNKSVQFIESFILKNQLVVQFINQTVKNIVQAQFTEESEFLFELTGVENSNPHQILFVQNMIGELVGISSQTSFDRYTDVLNDALIVKTRDEMLCVFFEYVTPESMLYNLIQAVLASSLEVKKALRLLLIEGKFWDNKEAHTLSLEGSYRLLHSLGYLLKA